MGRFALGKEEAASLLRNRPFLRLAIAQFSATMAIYGLSFAGVALVEERTHSTAQTGLVIVSSILPAFLGSLVAGAAVDRWGQVRALVTSHLVRVLMALAFWGGTTLLPDGLALTTVYVANGVGAGLAQFALSAELALLPSLVGQGTLIPANGLFQLGMLAGEGLGIVVVVPLTIKLVGAPWMGLVSALLCLLALALVAGLPADRPAPDRVQRDRPRWSDLGADLQAGWRTISRDRLLGLVTIQATLAASLLLVLLSLVPGMAARHLGLSAEDTPFLMLPGGLGFVLGAALMSRWQRRLSRPGWIALGLIILGLSVSMLAVLLGADSGGTAELGLVLVAILAVGLSLAMAIIPARAVLQERPPAAVRGRVIAAQLAMANAAAVLPLLIGGALADSFGIRPVMALLGLLALGSGGIGLRHAFN
jgi:MFS family permease